VLVASEDVEVELKNSVQKNGFGNLELWNGEEEHKGH
jgi:hypothetical protein